MDIGEPEDFGTLLRATHSIADIHGVMLSESDDIVLRNRFAASERRLRYPGELSPKERGLLVENINRLVYETSRTGNVEDAIAGLCPGLWPFC
jgi:hypothetical protein